MAVGVHHARRQAAEDPSRARAGRSGGAARRARCSALGDGIAVATGDGVLGVDELQLEGRKRAAGARSSRAAAGSRSETGLAATRRAADARRLAWQVLIAVEQGAFADAALGAAAARRGAGAARPRRSRRSSSTARSPGRDCSTTSIARRRPRRRRRSTRRCACCCAWRSSSSSGSTACPPSPPSTPRSSCRRTSSGGAASGLVNAVLRRFLREGKRVALPAARADLGRPSRGRAARIRAGWSSAGCAELGDGGDRSAAGGEQQRRRRRSLRVNRRAPTPRSVLAALADARRRGAAGALRAARRWSSSRPATRRRCPAMREGWFAVQGEASQLVGLLLGARPGARVLDACAAPGRQGDAARRGDAAASGCVVALDRHRARPAPPAARGARGCGCAIVAARAADATRCRSRRAARFDAVLVDAPCSGLGTLRQHPEIRWRRDAARRRRRSPRCSARCSPPRRRTCGRGGVLVYATCTISAGENDDVIDAFLAAHAEFVDRRSARRCCPAAARALVDAARCAAHLPAPARASTASSPCG